MEIFRWPPKQNQTSIARLLFWVSHFWWMWFRKAAKNPFKFYIHAHTFLRLDTLRGTSQYEFFNDIPFLWVQANTNTLKKQKNMQSQSIDTNWMDDYNSPEHRVNLFAWFTAHFRKLLLPLLHMLRSFGGALLALLHFDFFFIFLSQRPPLFRGHLWSKKTHKKSELWRNWDKQ